MKTYNFYNHINVNNSDGLGHYVVDYNVTKYLELTWYQLIKAVHLYCFLYRASEAVCLTFLKL